MGGVAGTPKPGGIAEAVEADLAGLDLTGPGRRTSMKLMRSPISTQMTVASAGTASR